MRHGKKLVFSSFVLGSVSVLASVGACDADNAADVPALREISSIELPGPPGKRFDYLVIDYDDDWLFSAHLAAGQTYVIDLKRNQVLHTVLDTPGVEGYVPDERKVYTSNAAHNTIGVIDLNTMKVVRKIATEAKPDGNTYAAPGDFVAVNHGINSVSPMLHQLGARSDQGERSNLVIDRLALSSSRWARHNSTTSLGCRLTG